MLWRALDNVDIRYGADVQSGVLQTVAAGALLEQASPILYCQEASPEGPYIAHRIFVRSLVPREDLFEVTVDTASRQRVLSALNEQLRLTRDVTVRQGTLLAGSVLLRDDCSVLLRDHCSYTRSTMCFGILQELYGCVTVDICKNHRITPFLSCAGAHVALTRGRKLSLRARVCTDQRRQTFYEQVLAPLLQQPHWQSDQAGAMFQVTGRWEEGELQVLHVRTGKPAYRILALWPEMCTMLNAPGEEPRELSQIIPEQVVVWGCSPQSSETWWALGATGKTNPVCVPWAEQKARGSSEAGCFKKGQAVEFFSPVFRRWVPAVVSQLSAQRSSSVCQLNLGPLGQAQNISPRRLRPCLSLPALPMRCCASVESTAARLLHLLEEQRDKARAEEDYDSAAEWRDRIKDIRENGVPCIFPTQVLDRYAQTLHGCYCTTDCMWELMFFTGPKWPASVFATVKSPHSAVKMARSPCSARMMRRMMGWCT